MTFSERLYKSVEDAKAGANSGGTGFFIWTGWNISRALEIPLVELIAERTPDVAA
jgi:hypothetical protein